MGYCWEQQVTHMVRGEEPKAGMQSWLSRPGVNTTTQTPTSIHLPNQCQIPHKQHGETTIIDLLQLLCPRVLSTDCN